MAANSLDVMGVAEVAALIGVAPKTVGAYLAREQMPAPDVRLQCGPIWHRETIEAWTAKREQRTERAEVRLAERRLVAELAEADKLRERLEAHKTRAFERALAS